MTDQLDALTLPSYREQSGEVAARLRELKQRPAVLEIDRLGKVFHGNKAPITALSDVSFTVHRKEFVSVIGPSGCGKSTLIRILAGLESPSSGQVRLDGAKVDGPCKDRGMVFQGYTLFPWLCVRDNVTFGPKVAGFDGNLDDLVEEALHRAALWDEVKDKLSGSAMALSGGQQQRLCIARAIATKPDVILMDEPCSALDPIATAKIEDLMQELRSDYTIVIVTHNMQQAGRVSGRTAFFTVDVEEDGTRTGTVVEFDRTETIFTNPTDPRTEAYITGRFG